LQCTLLFHDVERSATDHATLFNEHYFSGNEPDGYGDYLANEAALRRQARSYLSRIERLAGARSRLFDAGCAAGFLLDEARRRGWRVQGCDPSEWASQRARTRLGLEVETSLFEELLDTPSVRVAKGAFGAVTFVNVLEHCARPRAAIARAHALLQPGGVLLIETWDRDSWTARWTGRRWHQWSPARVTAWFNEHSLRALVHSDLWEWHDYGSVTRWIALSRGFEVLGVRPPRRLGSLLVPYPLDDLVVAVVVKR